MYVLKNRHKSPGFLLNTISNEKYYSMDREYQKYYEYLLGEVKKDTRVEEDDIEVRPDILGETELVFKSHKSNRNE